MHKKILSSKKAKISKAHKILVDTVTRVSIFARTDDDIVQVVNDEATTAALVVVVCLISYS